MMKKKLPRTSPEPLWEPLRIYRRFDLQPHYHVPCDWPCHSNETTTDGSTQHQLVTPVCNKTQYPTPIELFYTSKQGVSTHSDNPHPPSKKLWPLLNQGTDFSAGGWLLGNKTKAENSELRALEEEGRQAPAPRQYQPCPLLSKGHLSGCCSRQKCQLEHPLVVTLPPTQSLTQ